jgi:beta-galactosidase
VQELPGRILLQAGATLAEFDARAGTLAMLDSGRGNVVRRGPLLNVWRAAVDNDGFKLYEQVNTRLERWEALGLPGIVHQLRSVAVSAHSADTVTIEVVHAASGRGNWADFTHIHRYTLLRSGELLVDNTVRLGEGITDLPRVGVSLILDAGLERIVWFGRGPWENYSDRKAAGERPQVRCTPSDLQRSPAGQASGPGAPDVRVLCPALQRRRSLHSHPYAGTRGA